jgi:hypothetical protein
LRKATTVNFRQYTIKAMPVRDAWEARAFLSKAKQGSGIVAQASAPDEKQVLDEIRQKLDARDSDAKAARRFEESMNFHVPSEAEYAIALGIADLHKAQRDMLRAHARADEQLMTASELARSGGYSDFSTANLHYGKAGRLLADAMSIRVPQSGSRETDFPTGVIALWIPEKNTPGLEGRWKMHPELRSAIVELPL